MSFSLLTIVIFGITAAIIYKEIRKGYKHGLSRSLIRLATLIFCAIFSSVVSMLLGMLLGGILMTVFREVGLLDFLSGEWVILEGVLEMLLKMILSVILYLIVFYLLRGVVAILVRSIFRSATRKIRRAGKSQKKAPEYLSEDELFYVKNDKQIGAAVGVLSGLVLAIIVFMPLTGLLKSADDIAEMVIEFRNQPELEESAGVQMLDRYANDASGTVLYSCGGKGLFNLTASTRMYGHTTYLNKEIKVIRSIDVVGLTEHFKQNKKITGENAYIIEELIDDTQQSLALKIVSSRLLKNASSHWLQHEPYLGIERPNLGTYHEISGFFDSILVVCADTSEETYGADIQTILALITIFEEDEVFFAERNYETFMKVFVEGDILKRVEDELYKNPHMHNVNLAIDDLIMSIFATELEDSKYSLEQKAFFYKEIASIMSDSQGLDGSVQMIAISNGISDSFQSLGMYLPESLENRVANIFTANIPMNEQVTDTEIENLFGKYKSQS